MKLTKELDVLLMGEPGDNVGRLHVIHEQLRNKLTVLQKLGDDVLCDPEEIVQEIEESEAISATLLDYKRHIDVYLRPPERTTPLTPAVATNPPAVIPPTPAVAKTCLPRLELHKFKGDITGWNTFWDTFKAAVHKNPDISKIDKFHYLTSLLDGTAGRAIQGLSLTEGNYDSAIALLKERFGNPQAIISAHMDELLKLPDCSVDQLSALCNIYVFTPEG